MVRHSEFAPVPFGGLRTLVLMRQLPVIRESSLLAVIDPKLPDAQRCLPDLHFSEAAVRGFRQPAPKSHARATPVGSAARREIGRSTSRTSALCGFQLAHDEAAWSHSTQCRTTQGHESGPSMGLTCAES